MAYLKIIRPLNCVFVALTVTFGAFFKNQLLFSMTVGAAMLSAVFIAAGGYVINDYYDIEIDRINKPKRVLPTGKMSPGTAYLFAWIMFALGLGISYFTKNNYCSLIAVFNIIVLYLYAKNFKKSLLLGNFMVAYAAASTFIYGGLALNNLKNSIVIAVFAFIYTLLRELIKDMEDIDGDRRSQAQTLPVKIGNKNTLVLTLIPLVLILAFSIYLFLIDYFSKVTFILFIGLILLPLLVFFFYVFPGKIKKKLAQVSIAMKIDMFVLLILLWLSWYY